jgi:GH25 family lysozyme M1 (1,4-beta-N-acetylmuramidase)
VTTVPGLDVSYWQSGIDWPKVRATGQRFVFIKATEGEAYTDPTFNDDWNGSRLSGLLRGAYCFFHPKQDPKKQADNFISVVRAQNNMGELPPVIDLEVNDGITRDKIIPRVKAWLDEVEQAFGRKPMIYSGVAFLETNLSDVGGGPPVWAKDYPFWLSWYPTQYVDGMSPLMPRGWFTWNFWQYTENGALNGINTKANLDVFNGTLADLYTFAGAQMPAQTPGIHIVAAGDSFESIANKYGITVRELVSANPQLLKIDDKLTIPVGVAIPQESGSTSAPTGGQTGGGAPARTYTVGRGDTLSSIAVRFGTTVAALAAANNISNPNSIQIGQVLTIPPVS